MSTIIEYYEKYNILKIPNNIDSKFNLINELLNYNYNNDKYKFEKYYILFQFIINFIIDNSELDNDDVNNLIINSNIISYITMLNKGQHLLKLFKPRLLKIIKKSCINFIIVSSSHGTIWTFLFWLEFENIKSINDFNNDDQKLIIKLSIDNPDDRLYMYILTNNNNIINNNEDFIKDFLINICNIKIKKYVIQKLKILNEYINLNKYINYIIFNIKDFTIIIKLHKYYTIIYDITLLNHIINYNLQYTDIELIYNLLNTIDDQAIFILLLNLKKKILFDDKLINLNNNLIDFNNNIINIILNNYKLLIDLFFINYKHCVKIYDTNNICTNLLKIFLKYNLITKFLNNNVISIKQIFIYIYTRFYIPTNTTYGTNYNYYIKINLILHNLRMYIKYRRNKIIKLHKIYNNNLLNEILIFKPNIKKKVLCKGSYLYQLKQQEFTYKQSFLDKNNFIFSNCLIHKKINSIFVKNIPINSFPNNEIINTSKCEIKAEYIENLDLYLIIDINIPNTTILERYSILRNLHNYTENSTINTINNLTDFELLESKENKLIELFLSENKDKIIKWFPKFICYIDNNITINDLDSFIITSL